MADMPPRTATDAAMRTWRATIRAHPDWGWCTLCARRNCRERRRALAELIACGAGIEEET